MTTSETEKRVAERRAAEFLMHSLRYDGKHERAAVIDALLAQVEEMGARLEATRVELIEAGYRIENFRLIAVNLDADRRALIEDRIRKVWPGGPHDPPQWLVIPDGAGGDWTSYHPTADEALAAYRSSLTSSSPATDGSET
jgi:hypothetical protein